MIGYLWIFIEVLCASFKLVIVDAPALDELSLQFSTIKFHAYP